MRPSGPATLALLALLAALPGCTARRRPPDLGEIYDRVARAHHEARNPVILIPGVLGSRLVDESGTVVWGAFRGDYANPRTAEGTRLVALPMRRGAALSELVDGVRQDGALESLQLTAFGLPIGVGAYVNILLALGIGGYRDEALGLSGAVDYGTDHFTCFQFAYDWRRDISEIAGELDAYIAEKEAYVRAEYARRGIEREEVRFDVVAHSMGGLVLRYYLRHGGVPLPVDGSLPELSWDGARKVDRAVLIATPNAGALQSFHDLLDGADIGPFLPTYPPAVLGTMPSVYQLLPRPRHGAWTAPAGGAPPDALAAETWERFGWGLADPEQERVLARLLPDLGPEERRAVALDHQRKCLERARQLFRALDRPASPPPGTELMLVAGDAHATPATVEVDPASGRRGARGTAPGDETVLRSSALMDERLAGDWRPVLVSPVDWSRVLFFFEGHLALTQAPAFIDNLLYLLLEEPR
jgi:hypothetical protein